MKNAKKALCLLLSVIMLVSCFAIYASAVPADGKEVAYKLVADKETYNPGDTVTFSFYIDVADSAVKYGASSYTFSYDSKVLAPEVTNRTFMNEFETYYKAAGAVTSKPVVHNGILPGLQATGEADLYDASFVVAGIWNAQNEMGTPSAEGFAFATPGALQFTFQMKVLDTAAGLTGRVALTQGSVNTPLRTYLKHADGSKVTPEQTDLTNATATFAVAGGEQPATPVLNKDGRQVKMTVQGGAVVKGTEQLRVVSSISKADWDANFAQTATADTTKNAIQKVGIVANNGTVPFDMTTAQNVAKGTPANGYSVAETTYIQQAADNTYKFGARIEYKTDVYDTTYVAFVEYTDAQGVTQYMFYDAEASVAFKMNYKTITDQYIAKFPG